MVVLQTSLWHQNVGSMAMLFGPSHPHVLLQHNFSSSPPKRSEVLMHLPFPKVDPCIDTPHEAHSHHLESLDGLPCDYSDVHRIVQLLRDALHPSFRTRIRLYVHGPWSSPCTTWLLKRIPSTWRRLPPLLDPNLWWGVGSDRGQWHWWKHPPRKVWVLWILWVVEVVWVRDDCHFILTSTLIMCYQCIYILYTMWNLY